MKILVVDDNPKNLNIIMEALEPLGHKLLAAKDGGRALSIAESNLPDLILLDVWMPEMDGYAVCAKLKENDKLSDIPVLFLSAFTDEENKVKGFQAGGLDYIDKPFSIHELQARVSTHLALRQSQQEVKQKNREIEEEKAKSDELLHAMLPSGMVEELKAHGRVKPKLREDIAILMCDIAGYTSFSKSLDPQEVVGNMQEISILYENITEKHQLEKINAVGDSFLAAAGLDGALENPVLNAVKCGLELNEAIRGLSSGWQVRTGVHIGPVVVGVVGKKKFGLGMWGDTVNTAARMEKASRPGVVCLTATAWNMVSRQCEGELQGEVEIKGKGKMEIVFVSGLKPREKGGRS